jgi:hypothetical protein
MSGRQYRGQVFGFLNREMTPIIIKNTHAKIPIIDFGPIIFLGFPTIMSNVDTNITPATPSIIKIIPFVFIFISSQLL